MADMEFDLGEVVGSYDQAKADRDFYLSIVQGGTQMASPIAAYLAGVSGVKMANMRAKAQDIQDQKQAKADAIDATERLQKRQANLDNQIIQLVKGVREGSVPASVAATMIGRLGKERGIEIKQFDANRGVLIGREPGDAEDFEWDLSEGLNTKAQQAQERIDIARQREERLAKGAQDKAKMDAVKLQIQQKKLDDLMAGKTNASNTSAETKFLNENKRLFESINNPKGLMKNRPLSERIGGIADSDRAAVKNWLRGVQTLGEDAQERLGEITHEIAVAARLRGIITQEEFKKYNYEAKQEEQQAQLDLNQIFNRS